MPLLSPIRSEPIRIGFVLHGMEVAGAEMLTTQIIRRAGKCLRPTVFCLDTIGTLGEELRAEGIEVLCLGRRPGRDLRMAWRLRTEFLRRRIDVVHAHHYTPFFYAALAKVFFRHPPRLLFSEHGRPFPDVVSILRHTVNRLFLSSLADSITTVSRFAAASLAARDGFPRDLIGIIPNGVDAARYASNVSDCRARLGLSQQKRYLVNVGRHHPVKDHVTLLRAFRKVSEARPDTDLLLVGDGPKRMELESLCWRLGIESRVRFLGVRSDVPDILCASDIFVLSSLSEAAPLSVLEAMAAAVPVVVTNVGGNSEIVRAGRDGLLTPRGDADGLAAALIELLGDPARAKDMGMAGRARVRESFSLDATVDRYMRLYEELRGSGSCSPLPR